MDDNSVFTPPYRNRLNDPGYKFTTLRIHKHSSCLIFPMIVVIAILPDNS
jgi:hypothetical protein